MGLTQKLGTIPLAIFTDASNNIGIGGSPSGSFKFEVTGASKMSGFLGVNGSPATSFPFEAYINSSTAYSSTSRGNVMRVYNSNTGANIFSGIELGGAGTANDGLAGLNAVVTGSGSAALTFYTRDGGTFAERVRVAANGNVSLGTDSPTNYSGYTTLHINGKSGAAGGLLRLTAFDNSSSVNIYAANGINFNTTSAVPFIFLTQDTERMRITSGGYVCINSTSANGDGLLSISANVALHQGITIKSIGSQTGLYYIYFQNSSSGIAGRIEQTSSTSVNYTSGSDYRLKENIKPLENSIERLMKLKPCEFIWKEDQIKGEGFIAHELQEIVPSAVVGKKDEVDKNGNPVYQGIDASKMVHLLVSAIQEQQTLIQELSAKVSALENKS